MSLQFKKSNKARNLKLGLTAGVIVIASSYLVLNTFPHLKTSLYNYISGTKSEEEEEEEKVEGTNKDNEPIELNESGELPNGMMTQSIEQSYVNVAEWSDDNLKSYLIEKEVNPPDNASHDNLVTLVRTIQENPN
ncbi:uncharacterized protein J8A68_000255 [[Candida] subhashii]|uniref:Uncharacterized protein n=1 Tax=[Candida] subhashii TaxID=561895 RepID=A0A8J5QXF9_9ASCO|nr:uncharacterized protein J8A68_000255 [[Candida] subhashii]KAG7666210.1 hypothetical protein J8A68_000255 [[Candida] subhashii]